MSTDNQITTSSTKDLVEENETKALTEFEVLKEASSSGISVTDMGPRQDVGR